MATLTVTLPEGARITNGRQITFRAPCDCNGITGIIIGDTTYDLVDTMDTPVGTGRAFKQGSLVSVILDTENSKSYLVTTALVGIVDNLTSEETDLALSANQGKVLNDLISTHTHDYAGSSSPGGSADSAVKLETARSIRVNLESTEARTFDGTTAITPGVNGVLPIANGGTGASTAEGAITALGITPESIGAAKSSHSHSAYYAKSNIIYHTSSTLPTVVNGAILLVKKGV